MSGDHIDDAGVTAVAEALKVNTSVQEIELMGELCWCSLPSVHVVVGCLPSVCVCPCVCVWWWCVCQAIASALQEAQLWRRH